VKFLSFIKPFCLPNVGWFAVLAALGLTAIGLFAIDTAAMGEGLSPFVKKQAMFLPLGLIVMIAFALPHHRLIVHFAYPLLAVTLILLVIVLLPFMPRSIVPVINGARRWFDLKLTLAQPSELAKIAYILSLACYLRYRRNYRSVWGLAIPLVATFVPMGLILVEPDLGTAMLFLPMFLR
jgi:rod shape determining protein RodA